MGKLWVRILIGIAVVLILAVGLLLAAGAKAKADLKAAYPAPGRLVDVGGYRLHLHCVGTGSPLVLMEAGAGDAGLIWVLVQQAVGEFTTACVYDRAGHGWSDRSPLPPTGARIVEDLHNLLERAGRAGAHVLVGHSLGGLTVRLYRARYPGDVAGMVLVDSSHEAQWERMPPSFRDMSQKRLRDSQQQLRLAALIARFGVLALRPSLIPTHQGLPESAAAARRALVASDPKWLEAMLAGQEALERIFADARAAAIRSLGDIPLVVLVRGRVDALPPQTGIPPETVAEAEQAWRRMQAELAALSPSGRLIIAEQSGHYIQLDQPGLVIEAIRQVVTVVRR